MRAVREFPPNPNVVVFHLDGRLTEEIVETFLPGCESAQRPWVRDLVSLPGLRALSLNAYKVRVQKDRSTPWPPLLAALEARLSSALGLECIDELIEDESRRRRFAWHGAPFVRQVFEGCAQARREPVAAALFDLSGVAEVALDGHEVEVRKCPLAAWPDLAPRIEATLREMAAE